MLTINHVSPPKNIIFTTKCTSTHPDKRNCYGCTLAKNKKGLGLWSFCINENYSHGGPANWATPQLNMIVGYGEEYQNFFREMIEYRQSNPPDINKD